MTFTDVLIDYVFDHDLRKYDVNKRAKIIKLSINSKNRVESKNILGLLSYLARNLNKKEIKYFEKWCDAEARSVKKQISIRDFGVKASMDLLYSTIDTDYNFRLNVSGGSNSGLSNEIEVSTITALEHATNAVEAAEAEAEGLLGDGTDSQEEINTAQGLYDAADTLVSALEDSDEKTDLVNILSVVQSQIDTAQDNLDEVKANNVMGMIGALPSVENLVLDDGSDVEDARTSYNSLTEDQKVLVTNYEELTALEAELDEIDTAIIAVEAAEAHGLSGDGTDSQEEINTAQDLYNTADTLVDGLTATGPQLDLDARLVTVQFEIDAAQNALDEVTNVLNMIGDLPSVENLVLDDRSNVEDARTSYNSLTEVQKVLVTNYEELTALEAEFLEIDAALDAVEAAEAHGLSGDGTDSQDEINIAQGLYDAADTLVDGLTATGPQLDLDLGNRLVTVQSEIDAAQNALYDAKEIVDKLFTLSEGWNLISVGSLVDDANFIGGEPTKAYKFVEGSYLTANLDDDLTPLNAIFLEVLDERYVGVNYDDVTLATQTTKALVVGWNVISVPNSMDGEVINTALAQLIEGVNLGLTNVYGWDAGSAIVYNDWDTDTLSDESGYWVHMNKDKEFSLFVNPIPI